MAIPPQAPSDASTHGGYSPVLAILSGVSAPRCHAHSVTDPCPSGGGGLHADRVPASDGPGSAPH